MSVQQPLRGHPKGDRRMSNVEKLYGSVMTYMLLKALLEHFHYVMIFSVWIRKALCPAN